MELKKYQRDTLNVLGSFFQQCRISGHRDAYNKITSEPEIAERLGKLKTAYTVWNTIPDTPRVCIKVPTGGGKTIIAAHAIKIVGETWCEKEYPLVLWFVPSDTIRRQTVEALKNHSHPYRQTINDQFAGNVQVFDIDEKFNINADDIAGNACIIVSTMQSFVKVDTSKYNVYRDNENLEPHFTKMHPARHAGMELTGIADRPKYSFANLLYYHRPVMIVDEAHKVVADLSQETLGRINPSAVIELTATPQDMNNIIYNVSASELREAEMIKLPIILVEQSDWEKAVNTAIFRRAELEIEAKKEDKYIRPLLLFQAQSKDREVTVDVLKTYLVETAKLPEKEIRVVTGDQKELDGIKIFDPAEPTRYIITVEALKEGWDCNFAYVLCSLANIKSDTSVVQLLGRIMRMPYAAARKSALLNRAYAYVLSSKFGEAAPVLTDKLIKKGFDSDEAQAAIQPEPPYLGLVPSMPINRCKLSIPIDTTYIPDSIIIENDTLYFTDKTNDDDIKTVCKKLPPVDAANVKYKYKKYKEREADPSPASSGIPFIAPRLMLEVTDSEDKQGKLVFAEPAVIFENFDWKIADYASPQLSEIEFNVGHTSEGFIIDLDGSRLRYSYAARDDMMPSITDSGVLSADTLTLWLDKELHQVDIPQVQMLEWLRRAIEFLRENRNLPMIDLTLAKYSLRDKLLSKIQAARQKIRQKSFDFFIRNGRTTLSFDNGFVFSKNMYDDIPYFADYTYKFNKHYLGNKKIPPMDGKSNGEEFNCAIAIDSEPQVKFWIRNIRNHPASFRLPTSTDYFYPDFIACLNDDRILAVEYKGAHLAESADTKEKNLIGLKWEEVSNGKTLFMTALQTKDGLGVAEQIKEKIRL